MNAGDASLLNVTLAAATGYGIENASAGSLQMTNTIVAGNTAGACSGAATSLGNNLDDDGSCALTAAGDLSGVNPLLSPLADNGGATPTHALMAGSPAIDAGSNAACPTIDQRGVTRPADGDADGALVCDIGAYEALVFADVPPDFWASDWILALYRGGLTAGCATGPLRYCPLAEVTRAEMAVFLLRGIYGTSYTPPAPPTPPSFTDIDGHWAQDWIEALCAEGLVAGYPDGSYQPDRAVSRAEEAVFILRAVHGTGYTPPAPSGNAFPDIIGHWAEAWIEALAEEGFTTGYPDGSYRPEANVNRAEEAVEGTRAGCPHARGGEPSLCTSKTEKRNVVPTPVGVNRLTSLHWRKSRALSPRPWG